MLDTLTIAAYELAILVCRSACYEHDADVRDAVDRVLEAAKQVRSAPIPSLREDAAKPQVTSTYMGYRPAEEIMADLLKTAPVPTSLPVIPVHKNTEVTIAPVETAPNQITLAAHQIWTPTQHDNKPRYIVRVVQDGKYTDVVWDYPNCISPIDGRPIGRPLYFTDTEYWFKDWIVRTKAKMTTAPNLRKENS